MPDGLSVVSISDETTSPWPENAALLIASCARHPNRAAACRALTERTEESLRETGNGLPLSCADFTGLDLTSFDLRRARLNRALLFGANLSSALLTGASLICVGTERARFTGADLSGAYLHSFAAQVCNFERANLSGIADATGSLFHGCRMAGATFDHSTFEGTTFYQCDFTDATFRACDLKGVTFNECLFARTSFEGTHLDRVRFMASALEECSFVGASGMHISMTGLTRVRGIDLRNASMPGLSIQDCKLREIRAINFNAPGAQLNGVDLHDVDLSGAHLRQSCWLNTNGHNVRLCNANLDAAAMRRTNLSGLVAPDISAENLHGVDCNFDGAVLDGIKGRAMVLRDCSLQGASLRRAYLYRAMMTGDVPARLCLRGADLTEAVLVQSYVCGDLTHATMSGANLVYARLNQALLSHAKLDGAALFEASLVKTDVSDASLENLAPPFFADRTIGLTQAVERIRDPQTREILQGFLRRLDVALHCGGTRGST